MRLVFMVWEIHTQTRIRTTHTLSFAPITYDSIQNKCILGVICNSFFSMCSAVCVCRFMWVCQCLCLCLCLCHANEQYEVERVYVRAGVCIHCVCVFPLTLFMCAQVCMRVHVYVFFFHIRIIFSYVKTFLFCCLWCIEGRKKY